MGTQENGSNRRPRLAYLVSKFPTVTETFILREIIELERLGLTPALYTIRREHPEVVHDDAIPWLERLRVAPYASPGLWIANLITFLANPLLYIGLLMLTIRELWGEWHLMVRDVAGFFKAVAFARMMQAEEIRHIHAHWATHTAYMAYIIYRLTGISYSFTAHAHDIYVRKAMLRTKVRHARFVATISRFNVGELVRDCGEDMRRKIYVVRCGISPDQFRPGRSTAPLVHPFTIVTVASLRDYKGHPYAIKACQLLKERMPDFRWLVVGSGPDREMLEQMIKEYGVEDVFQLLGSRCEREVQKLMQDADLFVMSSIVLPDGRKEGIPVSLMEAMAVALPTVATRISGIPELVEDNVTGRLVPERDPEALAKAILDLRNNPDKAKRLARAGRQRVVEQFTIAENASRLLALFWEVLESPPDPIDVYMVETLSAELSPRTEQT
jgi:colanic acid/amylovoran biosynthesis glycosyltransferase